MEAVRRFFLGVLVLAAGFGAILVAIERPLPRSPDLGPAGAAAGPSAGSGAPEAAGATPSTFVPPRRDSSDLRINEAGLSIIKESEGLRLEAYRGVNGKWYIGYGRGGAHEGMRITEAEAEALLLEDVAGAEATVRRLVTVPLSRNEFSAMVSLCYNLGGVNFSKSAVVREINAGDRQAAADAFRHHVRAGYQVLEHLTARREKERALFLTPDAGG